MYSKGPPSNAGGYNSNTPAYNYSGGTTTYNNAATYNNATTYNNASTYSGNGFYSNATSPSNVVGYGVSQNTPSLALMILEHGLHGTSREILIPLLQQFSPVKESDIAQVLGMMAATHASVIPPGTALQTQTSPFSPMSANTTLASSWDVYGFVSIVQERLNYVNWVLVVQCLDYAEFYVHDYKGVEMIVKGFYYATKSQAEFPLALFCKAWLNVPGQLSFIRNALLAPTDFVSFAATGRRIVGTEDTEGFVSGPTKNALMHLQHQHWNSLDLMELLCALTESSFYADVRPIFELAGKQSPELLCLGLAYFDPPWNSTLHACLVKLISGFLTGQPSSPVVLPRLWRIHPQLMLLCMTELHRLDPTCLSRLLDIAQELKILPKVLDAKPFSFAIDMAALASRREHLNLDKWLTDAMRAYRDPFVRAVLTFLMDKCFGVSTPQRVVIPLSSDVLQIFMRALTSHAPLMSYENAQLFRELSSGISGNAVPPPLQSPTEDALYQHPLFSSFFSTTFSKEIEAEANACYEKIYSHEVSVHDIIETMRRLRHSSAPRDHSVFQCMVHNLLDEYRFFPKYPEKELTLTGVLFGLLIQHHLLVDSALGIALRFILDALRKPLDSKMWKFGVTALLQCQSRLGEWPPYCQHLMDIPTLHSHELYHIIEHAFTKSNARDLNNK